jgi:hypothetical protein
MQFAGVLVIVRGGSFRDFGGLGKGGRTVYSRSSEVCVVDEVFGRLWSDRQKTIGDFIQ